MHADQPSAAIRGHPEAGVLHSDRPEEIFGKEVAEGLTARPLYSLADPVYADAVIHFSSGSKTSGNINAAFWQLMMPGVPVFSMYRPISGHQMS